MHTFSRVMLAGFMMTSFLPTECGLWERAAIFLGLSSAKKETTQQSLDYRLLPLKKACLQGDVDAVRDCLRNLSAEEINTSSRLCSNTLNFDTNSRPLRRLESLDNVVLEPHSYQFILSGVTPLAYALLCGFPTIVKMLLEKGAKPDLFITFEQELLCNKWGENFSCTFRQEDFFEFCFKHTANREAKYECIRTMLPYVSSDFDMSKILERVVEDRELSLQKKLIDANLNLGRYNNQAELEKLIAAEHQNLPKSVEAQSPF